MVPSHIESGAPGSEEIETLKKTAGKKSKSKPRKARLVEMLGALDQIIILGRGCVEGKLVISQASSTAWTPSPWTTRAGWWRSPMLAQPLAGKEGVCCFLSIPGCFGRWIQHLV